MYNIFFIIYSLPMIILALSIEAV